jgi:hypothetical protein
MLPNHDKGVEKSVSNWALKFVLVACALAAFPGRAGAMVAPPTSAADAPGKPILIEAPPPTSIAVCSFRRPICVHGDDGTVALSALDALERAWETGLVLGVPLPRAFDAYLAAEPPRSAIAGRDGLAHFDYARTFAVLDARTAQGCARDFDAARELYAASALAFAPATNEATLRAEATALAEIAVPCASIDATPFQSRSELALADPEIGESAPFFAWVDERFAKQPGRALAASFALAVTRTRGDEHWSAEPDVFDVLRESLKEAAGPGTTFEDALAAFAVDRATMVEMADAPVRFDWDVAWPKTARALASPRAVAPTGAAYVRIDASAMPKGARLRVDATWEEHAKMRFIVVKLDAQGRALAQWEAKAQPKATESHLQVVETDNATAFLVVAANVGAWTSPFDPDEGPWEPHGWLLTIASE